MYDDFFFPYDRAKLWTKNMVLLSLSHFLLYVSLYAMLPALPVWLVQQWSCSYSVAGTVVAVFGPAMFLPGAFNSYLIDAFRRKNVCLASMFLFVVTLWFCPRVGTLWLILVMRLLQGALFGVITMTTGSTLVIDVTVSSKRTDANVAFAWVGRLGMAAGLVLGIYIYPYWDFIYIIYTGAVLTALAWLMLIPVRVSFRAPLNPPLLSLDRFLLPRALCPAVNMMLVSFIFGVIISHIYNELFYICTLIGLCAALLLSRWAFRDEDGRAQMELGLAALAGGLLLLNYSHGLLNSYVAALLIGTGMGLAVSHFFIRIIRLPMHCERGTGNNTYQLMWELGILAGFWFENMWAENHPDTIYWICIAVCVLVELMYEGFTHSWCLKRDRRQMLNN